MVLKNKYEDSQYCNMRFVLCGGEEIFMMQNFRDLILDEKCVAFLFWYQHSVVEHIYVVGNHGSHILGVRVEVHTPKETRFCKNETRSMQKSPFM